MTAPLLDRACYLANKAAFYEAVMARREFTVMLRPGSDPRAMKDVMFALANAPKN